jgi:hypothetical protein
MLMFPARRCRRAGVHHPAVNASSLRHEGGLQTTIRISTLPVSVFVFSKASCADQGTRSRPGQVTTNESLRQLEETVWRDDPRFAADLRCGKSYSPGRSL